MPAEVPTPTATPLSETGALIVAVSRRLFFAVMALAAIVVVAVVVLISTNWATSAAVVLSGTIGGFIGLQRRLKELTVEDLRVLANSWVQICLPPLIGGVLAMLLYVIFLSGLVSSPLFPHFAADPSTREGCEAPHFRILLCHHGADFGEYAKLVFWSFVAGFSEHFVTDIIGRFEGEAAKNAGATDDSPKPPQ
jgi:hypothetical protein